MKHLPKQQEKFQYPKTPMSEPPRFIGKNLVSNIAKLSVHRITDSEWQDRLFISNIRIDWRKEADLYATNDGLQRGVLAYADDPDTTITSVPDEISGATLIPTRKADKSIMRAE